MALLGMLAGWAAAASLERFPPPDFGAGYVYPVSSQTQGRADWLAWLDVGVLLGALMLAAWMIHGRRSRKAIIWLSVGSLLYFGFYRKGCVCPIGSIQNVAQGLFDGGAIVPVTVLIFFALPLVFALMYGRVFCGGVCPFGALQDLVLIRGARVPRWLDHGLGLMRWFYLGVAVLFAATSTRYLICEYDPFVGFFRMAARYPLWIWSGGVLLLSMFVGRPYCRYLCPYAPLLSLCSRVSARRVSITPDRCLTCHLCREACPFGAINDGRRAPEEAS
jgi:polyferredoxin